MSLPRRAIVASARAWIGTPYRHQASVCGVGADCLGLVRGVWRDVVGPEPEPLRPYSPYWAETGEEEALIALGDAHFTPAPLEDWREGDVLCFRFRAGFPAKHLAIATSATSIIHAHDGARVAEIALPSFWRRRIVRAFSFPGLFDA
jgi:NlpC/P60 family putative phage cell wall peptidase